VSVSIRDFPDRGVILAIEDCVGEDGYSDVLDIARALGQEDAKGLGVRLGWMRRFKMVEHHKHVQGRWRPTTKGRAAVSQATTALDSIESAKGIEFDLLRRTVQYRAAKRRR
jgi:hypothetical protein